MTTLKTDPRDLAETARSEAMSEPEMTGDWRTRGALSIPEAGDVLGVGRSLAFDLARRGDLPTIRLGRRRVVPTHALRCLLGEV
jgi:hypothetical protein